VVSSSLVRSLRSLDRVVSVARAEGSASDEVHPSEENQRADERGHR